MAALPLALGALLSPLPGKAQLLPWVGLSHEGAQLLFEAAQNGTGPGRTDLFGWALAAGDFNGDGCVDLAAAAPANDCQVGVDCGLVQVRFGWHVGALGTGVTLDPAAPGAPDPAERGDFYGSSLAVGDFNNDGHADLVVGVPREDIGGKIDAGAVQIHYGLPGDQGSIQWVAEHMLHQGTPGVPSNGDDYEHFGASLAAGDFNGDGHDDLAVGTPFNKSSASVWDGSVTVVHGHVGGLFPADAMEIRPGLEGLPGLPVNGKQFGHALAVGDFNRDGYDDLAVGIPWEDEVGAVTVLYGSVGSLRFDNAWHFSRWDLDLTVDHESRFGAALAAGDFDGDGYDDLAIGIPEFNGYTPPYPDMGLVGLVYGGAGGVVAFGHQFLWEDRLLGPGNTEVGDQFGYSLAAADFDGDGIDDLAIGSPYQDGQGAPDAGAVTVLRGQPLRAIGRGRRLIAGNPSRDLIPDTLFDAYKSIYGYALAAGDFDCSGNADLAIGAPWRDGPGDETDAGAVAVVYARETSLFASDFE